MPGWTYVLAALRWLTPRRKPRLTDPEDYARRSRYPAKRAADELAERDEAIARAWRDWS